MNPFQAWKLLEAQGPKKPHRKGRQGREGGKTGKRKERRTAAIDDLCVLRGEMFGYAE
ncbi:MAG: hypothetical protein WCC59_01240 [Terriglobales bacterium]